MRRGLRLPRCCDALGGNSPFLADLAVREAASLRALIAAGPDAVVAAAMAELAAIAPATRRDRVAAAMRRAKRIVALATAIADIGGIWPLERVTARTERSGGGHAVARHGASAARRSRCGRTAPA